MRTGLLLVIVLLLVLGIVGGFGVTSLTDPSSALTATPSFTPLRPTFNTADLSPTPPNPTFRPLPTFNSADLSPTAPVPTYISASQSPTIPPPDPSATLQATFDMRPLQIILEPDVLPANYTEADLQLAAERIQQRMELLYFHHNTQIRVEANQIIINTFYTNELGAYLPVLYERGLLEVVDLSMLSLELRQAYLYQPVMTTLISNQLAQWQYEIMTYPLELDRIAVATQLPVSIGHAHHRFNPYNGLPFETLLWVDAPEATKGVTIHEGLVLVDFNDAAEAYFIQTLNRYQGRFIGVVLDGILIDAPFVDHAEGELTIHVLERTQAAHQRAIILSGPLPIPLKLVSME